MKAPAFYHKDGALFWSDWCWGDDSFARHRMVRQAEWFESGKAYCPELGVECREAIAAFDLFHLEHVDV